MVIRPALLWKVNFRMRARNFSSMKNAGLLQSGLRESPLRWGLHFDTASKFSSFARMKSLLRASSVPAELPALAAEIEALPHVEHRQAAAGLLLDAASASNDVDIIHQALAACQQCNALNFGLVEMAAMSALDCSNGGFSAAACILRDFSLGKSFPSIQLASKLAVAGLGVQGDPAARRDGLACVLGLSGAVAHTAFQSPAMGPESPHTDLQQWAGPIAQQLLLPLLQEGSPTEAVAALSSVLYAGFQQLNPPNYLSSTKPHSPHGPQQLATEQALFWVACLPPSTVHTLSEWQRGGLLQSVGASLKTSTAPVSQGTLGCALQAVAQLAPTSTAGEQCTYLLSAAVESTPSSVAPAHFALALAALRAAPNADASACLLGELMRWACAQGCSSPELTRVPDVLLQPDVQQLLVTSVLTAAQQVSQDRPLRVAAVLRPAQELLALPQRACDLSLFWDGVLAALCVWEDGAALARFTAAMARAGAMCSPVGLSSVAAARGRARQRDFELSVARAGMVRMQAVQAEQAPTAALTSSAPTTSSHYVHHSGANSSSLAVQSSDRSLVAASNGPAPPPTVYAMPPLALPRTPPFSDEQWELILQGVLQITVTPLSLLQRSRTELGMSVTSHAVASGNKAEQNTGAPANVASAASVLQCGPDWAVYALAAGVRSLAEATAEPALAAAASTVAAAAGERAAAAGHLPSAATASGPGAAAAWAVCSQTPSRLLGQAHGSRPGPGGHNWAPGAPGPEQLGLLHTAAAFPGGRMRPKLLHGAVLADVRRQLAAAASAGNVAAAVDAADAVQLFDDTLSTGDFEALLAACEAAAQPNRADTLLGAMKMSLGHLSPTAVASAVQAHAQSAAPAPAAMHLMTAVEAGMRLPEHVFWSVLNACGDAGAVLAVHDVLSAGQDSGHSRLQHVNGAVHKGLLNVCGLRSGALTCVVWDALRSIRRDAELGRPVPNGLRVFCSKSQRITLEAVMQAMDPPLQCHHVTPHASRPFLGVAPEDMMAWLTTPSSSAAADADEWAQSTSLPMRLAAVTGIVSGRTSAAQAQLLLGDGAEGALGDLDMLQPVAEDAAGSMTAEQAERSAEYAQWHARYRKQTSYARTRTQVDSARSQAAATRRQVAKDRQAAADKRSADARASMRLQDVRTLGKVLNGRDGGRAWAGNGMHMATARTLKQGRTAPYAPPRDANQR